MQLQQRQAAGERGGTSWAERNGEQLVNAHYEGDALVLLVEGAADGSGDAQLLALLTGAVPSGTAIEINRVPGRAPRLGDRAVTEQRGDRT